MLALACLDLLAGPRSSCELTACVFLCGTAGVQRVELRAPPTSLAFVPLLAVPQATWSEDPRPQEWSLLLVSGGVPALPVSDAAVTPALAAASAAHAKDVAEAAQACFQTLVPVPSKHPAAGRKLEATEEAAEGREGGGAEGVTASAPWGLSGVRWQSVPPSAEGYARLGAAASSLGGPLRGAARGEEAWEDASAASRDAGDSWHQELCKRDYSIPEREFRKRKRNDRRGKAKA